MLTESQYITLKNKYDFYHAERKRLFPKSNWVDEERRKVLPLACTNDEISAIEIYEFCHDIPERYFAYVQHKPIEYRELYKLAYESCNITTWIGENLGNGHFGRPFQSNIGDWRIPLWITAINGKKYQGIFYFSAGDYCRIKQVKER